jgi:hypothetical protein
MQTLCPPLVRPRHDPSILGTYTADKELESEGGQYGLL